MSRAIENQCSVTVHGLRFTVYAFESSSQNLEMKSRHRKTRRPAQLNALAALFGGKRDAFAFQPLRFFFAGVSVTGFACPGCTVGVGCGGFAPRGTTQSSTQSSSR